MIPVKPYRRDWIRQYLLDIAEFQHGAGYEHAMWLTLFEREFDYDYS